MVCRYYDKKRRVCVKRGKGFCPCPYPINKQKECKDKLKFWENNLR